MDLLLHITDDENNSVSFIRKCLPSYLLQYILQCFVFKLRRTTPHKMRRLLNKNLRVNGSR